MEGARHHRVTFRACTRAHRWGEGAWHESGSTFVAKVSRDLCMLYPRDWPDRFLLRCSLLLTADLGS